MTISNRWVLNDTFPNNYLANITILTIFATILDRSNCKTMGKKILLLFMMVWLSVGVNAHKGSCDATWLGESKTSDLCGYLLSGQSPKWSTWWSY